MDLETIGIVDSEDGTLLLGDATALQSWRGSEAEEEDPEQSDRIMSVLNAGLPGTNLPLQDSNLVLWNIEGPGTTDIYLNSDASTLVLIRSWITDEEIDFQDLPAPPLLDRFGEFQVTSGYLAILWSGESGDCIHQTEAGEYSLDLDELMTETSGLILPLPNGTYYCFHDEIALEEAEARRCYIVRSS